MSNTKKTVSIDNYFLNMVIKHHKNIDKEFSNFGIGANEYALRNIITDYVNSKEDGYIFKVMEIGTCRSNRDVSTHHKSLFDGITFKPNQKMNYVMTDFQNGLDVDVLCDVHKLSNTFRNFDFILTFSGYEHFKYPQLASHEILKSLKENGIVFIQSHQSFALHGYPADYFRFSLDAYKSCFPKTMNCEFLGGEYSIPCFIRPFEDKQWSKFNHIAKSYCNSSVIIKKTGPTPENFIYDI